MEGNRYFQYGFDFMISRRYDDAENPFREAARQHRASGGANETLFRYGEMPFGGDREGFFAIYANGDSLETWQSAERQQDALYEAIARRLGALGITTSMELGDPRHNDSDIELYDPEGETIGILGGMSISGGTKDPRSAHVTSWGVNDFPEVDLTKYQ